jgi:phosphoribosylformylglycinamidine (FGAM) synthase-like amidotransferase family enzyme
MDEYDNNINWFDYVDVNRLNKNMVLKEISNVNGSVARINGVGVY